MSQEYKLIERIGLKTVVLLEYVGTRSEWVSYVKADDLEKLLKNNLKQMKWGMERREVERIEFEVPPEKPKEVTFTKDQLEDVFKEVAETCKNYGTRIDFEKFTKRLGL